MIGVVQSNPIGITCTSIFSMAEEYWMKDFADVALARRSACSFSSLGSCTSSTTKPKPIRFLTRLRYFFSCSPLASQSSLTCPTMTWKSLLIIIDVASVALARSRLVSRDSYLASLLVVGNQRQTAHSIWSPSRDRRTTGIPLACRLDEPSVWTIHGTTPCLCPPLL